VRLTAFIRTERDFIERKTANMAWVSELKAVASRLIRYHQMHQKLVIIDRQLTWIGSLNTLSHHEGGNSTREIMVLNEGRQFAERILRHEQAEAFAKAPPSHCPGTEMELARSESARRNYTWYWRCAAKGCSFRSDIAPAPPSRPRRSNASPGSPRTR
jgi:phosphatidylserine/phosphatidylglycerophosphate/cardiolipin synthase-like enzyme